MHLYRLGELTLYSLTDIPLIRVPINESTVFSVVSKFVVVV